MSRLSIVELLVLSLLIVNPATQRWVTLVLLRDVAVSVLVVVLFKLQEAFHPAAGVTNLPFKSDGFEHAGPLFSELALLSLLVKLQLTTLKRHPGMQLRSLGVVGRNPGRVVLLLKVHQLSITFAPELVTLLARPLETKFVEEINAGLGHVGRLPLGEELVLLFLGTNPCTELLVLFELLRDVAVPVGGMEALKLLL